MRRSPLSLYTPLLIVVLVQALIIAVAPSRPPQPTVTDGGVAAPSGRPGGSSGDDAPIAAPESAAPTTSGPADPAAGTPTDEAAGPAGATPQEPDAPTQTAPTETSAPPGETREGSGATAAGPTGDTSHCTEDGRQHGVTYHAPPCEPTWSGGDNGGATWRGVTADTVTVVLFRENKDEQVTRILNTYGLRATKEEDRAFMDAAEDFVNEYYELYGRKLDLILFDAENCPETPPDVPACRAEAKRAIAEHDPFAVLWPAPIYPEVYDEFVREQVIALGGWHHDNSYFAGRRPYRYDVFMDGTRSADVISEYVCKKLVGGNATNAGAIIHASYPGGGARDQVPRKFGIIVPEPPATRLPAERAIAAIEACGGEAEMYSYVQDVTRARATSDATITSMIDDQVTSVICMCDPIAPLFRTESASRHNFYPEWVLPGLGLLDYDLLGRLYDKRQLPHFFGPSHLQLFPPHSQSDSSRVWRASGREGDACASCNLNNAYFLLIASMIQQAGPDLNPQTVEAGVLNSAPRGGWAETGGDPTIVLSQFGRDDYTLLSDFKEVYWREDAISRIDGRPGAYVPMYGGERWRLGNLPRAFEVPRAAS